MELRLMAADIRLKNLQNKNAAKELEKAAEDEKSAAIKRISAETVKFVKLKKDPDGEKIIVLENSIELLVNFIDKGGEVDFVIPDEDELDEEGEPVKPKYEELRINYQEIRQLEGSIKLLELGKD